MSIKAGSSHAPLSRHRRRKEMKVGGWDAADGGGALSDSSDSEASECDSSVLTLSSLLVTTRSVLLKLLLLSQLNNYLNEKLWRLLRESVSDPVGGRVLRIEVQVRAATQNPDPGNTVGLEKVACDRAGICSALRSGGLLAHSSFSPWPLTSFEMVRHRQVHQTVWNVFPQRMWGSTGMQPKQQGTDCNQRLWPRTLLLLSAHFFLTILEFLWSQPRPSGQCCFPLSDHGCLHLDSPRPMAKQGFLKLAGICPFLAPEYYWWLLSVHFRPHTAVAAPFSISCSTRPYRPCHIQKNFLIMSCRVSVIDWCGWCFSKCNSPFKTKQK